MTTIGLDIGGTWTKAWLVRPGPCGLETEGEPVLKRWNASGFCPIDLRAQVTGAPIDANEEKAGVELRQAATAVVLDLAKGLASVPGLSVATAGPKTKNGRGIHLWRRGPRIPNLLDDLLAALAAQGFVPSTQPTRLFDDGLAAAAGEIHATQGSLSGINEALYIGPGTGVAEAHVSKGRLAAWPTSIAPAYAEPMPKGGTFGDGVALSIERGAKASFTALGHLIRLRTKQFAAAGLAPFDRIVIGARAGKLLHAETQTGCLWQALGLVSRVHASGTVASAAVGAVALERLTEARQRTT